MSQTVSFGCPLCGQGVSLSASAILLDDEDESYTFDCPECGQFVRKALDSRDRALLRSVGSRTVDEVVESESVALVDETDADIWRGILAS